jgi:predicted DNA-binding transcriptional regulator YafY
MNENKNMVREYLMLGAIMRKVVEIEYRYLDMPSKRIGGIQPIKWLHGRNGLHILTWDVEANQWRRFAVSNIERVTLTDTDWIKQDLQPSLLSA